MWAHLRCTISRPTPKNSSGSPPSSFHPQIDAYEHTDSVSYLMKLAESKKWMEPGFLNKALKKATYQSQTPVWALGEQEINLSHVHAIKVFGYVY